MSIEKQNDPIKAQVGWIILLDHLKLIPGQPPIDKEQAWGKLYDRLKGQTHPKSYSMYWIAAACLFCLFAALGIKIIEQENSTVKNITSGKRSVAINSSPGLKAKLSPALVPAKNEIIRNRQLDQGPSLHASRKLPGIAIQETKPPEISAAFSRVLIRSRVLVSNLLVSPAKRVLQVIPLNESGFSLDPNLSSASRSFKLKIYNPANLDLPSLADGQLGQPAVKIKLAAQN
jgi:hypothetical protein